MQFPSELGSTSLSSRGPGATRPLAAPDQALQKRARPSDTSKDSTVKVRSPRNHHGSTGHHTHTEHVYAVISLPWLF